MTDDDICGSTDTTTGDPCRFSPGKSCPYHDTDDPPENGRPSKFGPLPVLPMLALDAARQGKSKAGCARAAGIGEATLERWRDEHEDFRSAFRRARSAGEDRLIEGGLTDDGVDSSMAKFLLSTSFDYVKTEKREHSTPEGQGPLMEIVTDGDG